MYPGFIAEYVDQSFIEPITIETVANRPLLFALFTSDKGPEDFRRVVGDDFFKLYGNNISFEKHGQALLQAAMSINYGAELFCKRVVASDAKLANQSIIAKVDTSASTPTISYYAYIPYGANIGDASDAAAAAKRHCQEMFNTAAEITAAYTASEGTPIYTNPDLADSHLAKSVSGLTDENGLLLSGLTKNIKYSSDPSGWSFTEGSDQSAISYYVAVNDPNTGELPSTITDIATVHYFAMFSVAENGRGTSTKSFSITENAKLSKNTNYAIYDITIHEGANIIETIHFALDPNTMSDQTNIGFNEMVRNATQFSGYQDPNEYEAFINFISEKTGTGGVPRPKTEILSEDILFCKTRKGQTPLTWITWVPSSVSDTAIVNITDYSKLPFGNGSNGSFGSKPIASAAYASEMEKVFTDTDASGNTELYAEIFDCDQYMITAIIDADYPENIKNKLANLAITRQDCIFFRDMGTPQTIQRDATGETITYPTTITGVTTMNTAISDTYKEKFTCTYCQYYDIKDPYTFKQITVTIGYSLARLFMSQYNNGINLPFAGQKYGMTIPEAIAGTLSFAPVNTPLAGNQKEVLDDARVNYASYFGDLLVLETEYDTYAKFSQFSYINNILAIQEAVRAVRKRCPLIRYSFISGGDFDSYMADVNAVLSNYTNNFLSLELEYLGDETYVANKIFYAAIKARFKDFVQTEYFKVIALSNTEVS